MPGFTEDELIEQPAIALFAELGYETARCFHETLGERGTLGRENQGEVVLTRRLRAALARLNPGLPNDAISGAIEELTRDRSALSPVHANREVHGLLKDGVKVTLRDDRGEEQVETVRVIDWNEPGNNDFFLASQLWVSGEIYRRRADLVAFVNGLPLVLIELKASHKRLEDAYTHNLRDYKETIPQLFWHNAFIILSNGSESRIGTITAEWEHFAEWKRINDEGERGVVSLETMIRGTCAPARLLDLVENFILFSEAGGAPIKIIAKNHQYLGVNRAFARLRSAGEDRRRLGVFWHTQGSGKSYSMVFFSQKVLRKLPGDWTFVVVTDRTELDDQIYRTFVAAGAVQEAEGVHAESGEELKRLLRGEPPVCLHVDPEVPDRGGGDLSGSLGAAGRGSDHRRSAPDTVRDAGDEHAAGVAERWLHRVHGHTADRRRGEDARGLRRLHQHLQLPASGRGRGDGAALLREPGAGGAADERDAE